MSRRQKAPNQRLTARAEFTTGDSGRPQSGKTIKSKSVLTASTASSRAKEKHHTSLRANSLPAQKDLKSASMIQVTSNRSKLETKPKRKVPLESEAFFTNLLLLGFDPDEVSAKHRGTSIPFDKDMFQVPNMLAFQVVMHFLLTKLDAVKFHEDFRDCWPICDRKQEQAFRKACLSWLTEISEKEPEAHLPRLVPSLFLSPGGTRFYQLMLGLSRFVLVKTMRQDSARSKLALRIHQPVLTPKNNHLSEVLARTMKELVARKRSSFFTNIQQSLIVNRECEQFAGDLVNEYRHLHGEVREKQNRLDKLRSENECLRIVALSPRGLDSVSAKRREQLASVRENWTKISEYYDKSRKEREVVSSIIKGTIDRHRIHASDYNVTVPDILMRTCQEEIQKRKIGNTYEGGKLDLISVLKLWILSIELCMEKMKEARAPNLERFVPNLLKHVHDVSSYLANLRALKNKINEVDLPELRRSITELRTEIDSVKTPGKLWQNPKDTIGFVPPTPPISFEDSGVDEEILPRVKGKTPPEVGGTPEAAARIMKAVNQRALRQPTKVLDSCSKLPKPQITDQAHESALSSAEVAPLWRLRQHSAPGATSTARISTPTRPRVVNHLTARKPLQKIANESVQKLKVAESRQKQMPVMKQSLVVRNVPKLETTNPTKPVIRSKAGQHVKPCDLENQSQGRKRIISKELFTDSPKSSKEKAEEHLIDRIVDAVTSETSDDKHVMFSGKNSSPGLDAEDVNLQDPLLAMSDAAFQKRDKLAYSPVNGVDTSPNKTRRVKFSPSARVELEPDLARPVVEKNAAECSSSVLEDKCQSETASPDRNYISPLPEFDEPILIPSFSDGKLPDVQVHEPSPARLQAMSQERKSSVSKSPVTSSVPVLDLQALSPTDDVMDASLELVDLSLGDSDEEQSAEELVPSGNLIGFIPREPTPTCITPYKGGNDSSLVLGRLSPGESPQKPAEDFNANVLNSEEKIEQLHEVEKSFEQQMLNISLKATGTPNYAKNHSLIMNDDDVTGLPRTPIGGNGDSPRLSTTPRRITFDISPSFDADLSPLKDSVFERGTGLVNGNVNLNRSSEFLKTSPDESTTAVLVKDVSRLDIKTDSEDIISRYRSLKARAQTEKSSPKSVVTPDEDKALDEIYLQQSPRREPDGESTTGKFSLDLHFDAFESDSELPNDERSVANDSEVMFRSPEKVVHQLNVREKRLQNNVMAESFHSEAGNLSGLLGVDVEDILVPNSPMDGDLLSW